MAKKLIFTNTVEELNEAATLPYAAINDLPDWYKKTNNFVGGKFLPTNGTPNLTIKKCIPVLDSMSAGYIISSWTEVFIERNGEDVTVHSSVNRSNVRAVDGHPIDQQAPLYPVPPDCDPQILKWINPWHIKTPKGYSCMFINPMHRDLPFKIIEGIVDTDTFPLSVNFPFFLKKGFEGIIKHNTPIVQVIPFKRENFYSERGVFDEKTYIATHNYHDSSFFNRYKSKWWTRKVFK